MSADLLGHELRAAWRQLLRRRGASAAALLTLALGIATATAMFALVDGVVLRPLPVRDQSSLAVLWRQPPTAGGSHIVFTTRDVDAIRRSGSRTLDGVAGVGFMGAGPVPVMENGQASSLDVSHVTGSFFDVLGAVPVAGRALGASDDVTGATGAHVISYGTRQRRYGGAPDTIGRRLFIA